MEWKEYEMSELIEEISMGPFGSNIKVECFTDSGVPVLNGSNLVGFRLNEDSFNYVTEEKATSLGKANAYRGDIVITHRGTLGQIVYIPQNSKYSRYVISQSQFRVRCNEKVIPEYLVYYFHSRLGQHKLLSNASQVGVPSLARPTSTFQKLTISIPPVAKQKEIVKILSSLDDKIELNNAINRNLEEQAQILFKNYEENKPFEVMKIADVADINPDSFGLKDSWSFVNYLDTSSITQNVISELQYINLNEEKLPSRAKRKVLENDIVYSTVRPNQLHFGFINEVKPNMLVSTGFAVIRSKNLLVSNEYIYLNLTKRDTIEKLQQIAEQSVSTFPAIKPSDIGDCLINVFEKKDAEILNNQLSAVFKKISQNNQENQRLALIRDSLLPKLMSTETKA